jgi:predicted HicB family RNase H-like nuclease
MMQYKGYSGVAEIAFDTGMIYGRVVGLRDVITFQGHTVAEAEQAFRDSVDDYLDLCASRNEAPEKPFSGKFLLRIEPQLHRALVVEAQRRGVSLNALVESTLNATFPGMVDPPRKRPARTTKSEAAKPKAKTAKPKPVAAKDETAAKPTGPPSR